MEYLISLVLGAVASWLQGQKGKELGKGWRLTIAFISCFAVAIGANLYDVFIKGGSFDINDLLATFGIAFGASQIFYNTYFRDKI